MPAMLTTSAPQPLLRFIAALALAACCRGGLDTALHAPDGLWNLHGSSMMAQPETLSRKSVCDTYTYGHDQDNEVDDRDAQAAPWVSAGRHLTEAAHNSHFVDLLHGALTYDLGDNLEVTQELMDAIAGLRRNGMHHLAMVIIESALKILGTSLHELAAGGPLALGHLTQEQLPLLEELVYEAGVSSWYTREYRSIGLAISDLIILDPHASTRTHRYLWSNVGYFVEPLQRLAVWDVDIAAPAIDEGWPGDSDEYYRPLNPSIIRDTDGGYTILCKTVNFDQLFGREYYVLHDDGYVRVRNFLIKVDANMSRISQYEVVEHLDRVRTSDHGLEDMRIIRVGGDIWFTAFTRSFSESANSLTVVGRIANAPSAGVNGTIDVEQMVLMEVPDYHGAMEKNWMPFAAANGELLLAYSVGPRMVVLRPDTATGANETLVSQDSPFDLSRFRGSAGPLDFEFNSVLGHLFVVHEVVYKEYKPGVTSRTYYHRFVFVDSEWKVTHVSRLFIFDLVGVEFCAGMVFSHSNTSVLLSAGIQDRHARIYEVAVHHIASLLVVPSLIYTSGDDQT